MKKKCCTCECKVKPVPYLERKFDMGQRGYFIVYNVIDTKTGGPIATLNDYIPFKKKITYIDIIRIQLELTKKHDAICAITFYKLIKSSNDIKKNKKEDTGF